MKRALAAAVVVLWAISAAVLPAPAETGDGSRRRVRVALSGWENNITPYTVSFASQPTTVDLLNLVYDTLFWSQARRDPEPWLAERADPSPDRRTWTVKLRSGVQWHDGKPFTAEDVKFTFEYFKRHAGESGRYGHHVADVPTFERGQVLSPTEVRLAFADPVPAFRTLPGADLPMLPRHIWENIPEPLQATEGEPVGTGPFTVTEITPRERYRLHANSRYFKGKPLIDDMEISIAGDPNVSFNDLVAGKVDLVSSTVPPVFVDQLTANPELKVVRASRMESVQLNFNARKQPLSDPKLRKAVSLSIDNRVLTQTVLGGRGRPGVDSFIHPESAWAAPNPQHEFDVAKANQILDAAGYSRKDSDGIRKAPDGKRLEFAALFSTLEPQSLQALQLISQMTTAIGVRMEPEPATPGELREVRRSASGAVPVYDAYVSQLEVHTHSDPDAFYFFFHSPGKGIGAQITGYSNQTFDRLIEEAATTVDLSERKRKLNEAQSIFAAEAPSLALYYPQGVYAFRSAAYDGWIPDPGHGIFTKRSFLEDYAGQGQASRGTRIPPAWVFLGGVAALVIAGSALVLFIRRPSVPQEQTEEPEPLPGTEEKVDELATVPAVLPAEASTAVAKADDHLPGAAGDETVSAAEEPAGSGAPAGSYPALVPDGMEEPAAGPTEESTGPPPLPEPPRWSSFIAPGMSDPPQGPPKLPELPAPEDLPDPRGALTEPALEPEAPSPANLEAPPVFPPSIDKTLGAVERRPAPTFPAPPPLPPLEEVLEAEGEPGTPAEVNPASED